MFINQCKTLKLDINNNPGSIYQETNFFKLGKLTKKPRVSPWPLLKAFLASYFYPLNRSEHRSEREIINLLLEFKGVPKYYPSEISVALEC